MGVGSRPASLFFSNDSDTVNKVIYSDKGKKTTRVNVVTLDSQLSLGNNYFLKIDVEGIFLANEPTY